MTKYWVRDQAGGHVLKDLQAAGDYALHSEIREKLTANRTYNVPANFATGQAAMDYIAQSLDVAGYTVTVQLADATYTAGVQLKPWVGAGIIVIQGNAGTPANVFFDVTAADIFSASFGVLTGIVRIKDLKTRTAISGFHIISRNPGRLQFTNIVFDTAPAAHIVCSGGLIEPYGNYSIIGGSAFHWITDLNSVLNATASDVPTPMGTITLTGTPGFAIFAIALGVSFMYVQNITFSGAATGTRYLVNGNALIHTNGGGATYLPGNAAGSFAEGGIYK